jgi:hypothetical protein
VCVWRCCLALSLRRGAGALLQTETARARRALVGLPTRQLPLRAHPQTRWSGRPLHCSQARPRSVLALLGNSGICSLIQASTHPLNQSLNHSFTHSLNHSFTHSLIHSFTHSHQILPVYCPRSFFPYLRESGVCGTHLHDPHTHTHTHTVV